MTARARRGTILLSLPKVEGDEMREPENRRRGAAEGRSFLFQGTSTLLDAYDTLSAPVDIPGMAVDRDH